MPAAFQSTAELEKQFDLTKRNQKVMGNALYSARYIIDNKIQITDKLATIYKHLAVMPMVGRAISPAPAEATGITIADDELKWSTSGDVKSVVYYFSDLTKEGDRKSTRLNYSH